MRNRWYDPEAGRFVNEDPAGFAGGANRYAFAGNDPINGIDASGLGTDVYCIWSPTLNAANRYAILWRIETAKKPETRARHIEKFIAMLEKG